MFSLSSDNCLFVTKNLIRKLRITSTDEYLSDTILSHPDHPSLICISDTLKKYNIESLAVKVDQKKLLELPMPCIVQFYNPGFKFHVLTDFSNSEVKYLDDYGSSIVIQKKEFLKRWTGICLLAETTDFSGEPDIKNRLRGKRIMNFLKLAVVILFCSWFLIQMTQSFILKSDFYLLGIMYLIVKYIGLATGAMLLWYEVDKYNPTLQSFCSGSTGRRINCDAVLKSKYSSLFNGQLSLGLLGFAYFFGTLSLLIITSFSGSSLTISSYSSLAVAPTILISTYYQAIVIKQWCKFCIVIQAMLLFEVLIVLISDSYKGSFELLDIIFFLTALMLPILVWKWLHPVFEKYKEVNLYKRELKKIKYNPNVLSGLLFRAKKISTSTKSLGISFNNKIAEYNVIKVCNPYCSPCAKAHPILDELVKKKIISLQVLFTVNEDEKDIRYKPVSHFLAIAAQGNDKRTQLALSDWYHFGNKDYEAFTKKYPINGELKIQHTKIRAMSLWCNDENITQTPTLFINGHRLPKEYSVEDLKEVLVKN